jgi:hypothetical protein
VSPAAGSLAAPVGPSVLPAAGAAGAAAAPARVGAMSVDPTGQDLERCRTALHEAILQATTPWDR